MHGTGVIEEYTFQVEFEFTTPLRAMRNVWRVEEVQGAFHDISFEAKAGELIVEGFLHTQVRCLARDGSTYSYPEKVYIKRYLDLPQAIACPVVNVIPEVESVQHRVTFPPGRPREAALEQRLEVKITALVRREEHAGPEAREPVGKIQVTTRPFEFKRIMIRGLGEATKDVRVPLTFPALHVVNALCRLEDIRFETASDKSFVRSNLNCQVFYVSKDGIMRHESGKFPFAHVISTPGGSPEMEAGGEARVKGVLCKVIEFGRATLLSVTVGAAVALAEVVRIEAVLDVLGSGTSQEKTLVRVKRRVAEESSRVVADWAFDLEHSADEVVKVSGTVEDLSFNLAQDKVVVYGGVKEEIFYTGQDGLEHHQIEKLPFGCLIEIPGTSPNMKAVVVADIQDIAYELEKPKGRVTEKAVIEVRAGVVEVVHVPVVTEANGPGIETRREFVEVEEIMVEDSREMIEGKSVSLRGRAKAVTGVVATVAGIITEVLEGRVAVGGVIRFQVHYVGWDGIQRYRTVHRKFGYSFSLSNVSPGITVEVDPCINHTLYELDGSGRVVDVKATMTLRLVALKPIELGVVTSVMEKEGIKEGGFSPGKVILHREFTIMENIAMNLDRPYAKAIFQSRSTIRDIACESCPEGKALVKATIQEEVYYVGTDNLIHYRVGNFPFSHPIEIGKDGSGDGLCVECHPRTVETKLVVFSGHDHGRSFEEKLQIEVSLTKHQKTQGGIKCSK